MDPYDECGQINLIHGSLSNLDKNIDPNFENAENSGKFQMRPSPFLYPSASGKFVPISKFLVLIQLLIHVGYMFRNQKIYTLPMSGSLLSGLIL